MRFEEEKEEGRGEFFVFFPLFFWLGRPRLSRQSRLIGEKTLFFGSKERKNFNSSYRACALPGAPLPGSGPAATRIRTCPGVEKRNQVRERKRRAKRGERKRIGSPRNQGRRPLFRSRGRPLAVLSDAITAHDSRADIKSAALGWELSGPKGKQRALEARFLVPCPSEGGDRLFLNCSTPPARASRAPSSSSSRCSPRHGSRGAARHGDSGAAAMRPPWRRREREKVFSLSSFFSSSSFAALLFFGENDSCCPRFFFN